MNDIGIVFFCVCVGMALEYDPTKIQSSVSEGDNLRLDQIPTADTPESRKQKPPLVEILWTNVVKYALLHVGALYGFTRIPSSHPFTWLWSRYTYNVRSYINHLCL